MTSAAELLENSNEETKTVLLWFGHFVSHYAAVESFIHVVFRRYSGLTDDLSRSIASKMRLADLLSIVKVVIAQSKLRQENKEDITSCIDQLNHLTTLRHRLIHRGFSPSAGLINRARGVFMSSNVITARTRESVELLQFQLDDIKAAARDCLTIYERLQIIVLSDDGKLSGPVSLTEEMSRDLYGPWLYRPLQTEMPNKSTHTIPYKPKEKEK